MCLTPRDHTFFSAPIQHILHPPSKKSERSERIFEIERSENESGDMRTDYHATIYFFLVALTEQN